MVAAVPANAADTPAAIEKQIDQQWQQLEPVIENPTDWFAEMDKHADDTFLEEGRDQPPTPERDMFD